MGTPVFAGYSTNANTVTTTVDIPVGSLVVVSVGGFSQTDEDYSTHSVTDGHSNTYTFAVQSTPTSGHVGVSLFYCSNTANDIPSGSTITYTHTGVSCELIVGYVTGYNGGLDVTNQLVQSSSVTSITLSVPTLAQANELVIGTGASDGNFNGLTEGNSYTNVGSFSAGAHWQDWAYLATSTTTPAAYNPSWSSSGSGGFALASFKASGGGGAVDDIAPRSSLVSLIHW